MFFGKKIKDVFNTSSGAASDVRSSWQYTTHPDAGKALEAAGARYATVKELADFFEPFSQQEVAQNYRTSDHDLRDGVYIATRDFHLPPLHGALSIDIIVPKGIKVTHDGNIGHSKIFDMNDASLTGNSLIFMPRDVKMELARRGCHPVDRQAPPPATPEEIATKAAVSAARDGIAKSVTVRRISLKQNAS